MPIYEVRTSQHSYPNVVERGAILRLREFLPKASGKVFVVTTEDVWALHKDKVEASLEDRDLNILFFPGGESNKRLAALEALAEELSMRGADRRSVVVGFGGGIVTDVGGFLAAVFMRGLPVVQVPTTLLAQVDAATGGKTGVNLKSGKNLIGSFHQPEAVLIDPGVLETLPRREYRAGLFEIIKCGVIRDPALFSLFETRRAEIDAMEPNVVDTLISGAVRIKAEVVTEDEKEGDLRRILNFGHTVGHALEAVTGYQRFLHGEAVGLGMLAATSIAVRSGHLSSQDGERIGAVVRQYGPLPSTDDLDDESLIKAMGRDKKTIAGTLHFVLPTRIGEVKIVSDVPDRLVREALAESLLQCQPS